MQSKSKILTYTTIMAVFIMKNLSKLQSKLQSYLPANQAAHETDNSAPAYFKIDHKKTRPLGKERVFL